MLSSYGFRYTETSQDLLKIYTIGYQRVEGNSYDFHGMKRPANQGMLFQYSLSGSGWLEIDGMKREVPRGHAFLVELPGEHRYYYDPASKQPWEVLWIRFDGRTAKPYWEQLCRQSRIVQLDKESAPIRFLLSLYADAKGERLHGPAVMSSRVYEWLVHAWEAVLGPGHQATNEPGEAFPLALQWMKEHLHRPITLQELADREQLSKYHFCKQFHHKLGMTPIAYLNKLRMEQAVSLLASTDLPVADIARMTGFESSGYFAKVFKRIVGGTPSEYRESKHEPASSVLRIF